jgi:hypothetical protein
MDVKESCHGLLFCADVWLGNVENQESSQGLHSNMVFQDYELVSSGVTRLNY